MNNFRPIIFVIGAACFFNFKPTKLSYVPTCDKFFENRDVIQLGEECFKSLLDLTIPQNPNRDLTSKLKSLSQGKILAFILDDISRFKLDRLPNNSFLVIQSPIDGEGDPRAIFSPGPIILSEFKLIDRNHFLTKLKDDGFKLEKNYYDLFVVFRNLGLLCGVPERKAAIYALKQIYNIVTYNLLNVTKPHKNEFPDFFQMKFVEPELKNLNLSSAEFLSMRPFQVIIKGMPVRLEYHPS